ncbi:MAG: dihydrofolate reductase [Bacteroidetes bacterium]|nr:dihydrofolate reductase [Bacteroidota bacterium]
MNISLIVAASENNAIGKNNELLWRLPNDMKFFKNTTWAMPVIMGRKTFDSLAGEPLPGRYNIVVTRNHIDLAGCLNAELSFSPEEALLKAKEKDCKEVFIAGGQQIYNAFLPVATKIYITRVHAVLDGDAFFPAIDTTKWKKVYQLDFAADEKHAYPYSFQTWVKA